MDRLELPLQFYKINIQRGDDLRDTQNGVLSLIVPLYHCLSGEAVSSISWILESFRNIVEQLSNLID